MTHFSTEKKYSRAAEGNEKRAIRYFSDDRPLFPVISKGNRKGQPVKFRVLAKKKKKPARKAVLAPLVFLVVFFAGIGYFFAPLPSFIDSEKVAVMRDNARILPQILLSLKDAYQEGELLSAFASRASEALETENGKSDAALKQRGELHLANALAGSKALLESLAKGVYLTFSGILEWESSSK